MQIGITRPPAPGAQADPVVSAGLPAVLRRFDQPARRRQLRIALIRQSFRFDGGGEQIVSRIDEVLRKNGHDVTLIARKWDDIEANVLKCDPPRWTRTQRESRFAREAMRLARLHQFDIVQCHERIPGCQVYRAGDGVHESWLEQRVRGWPGWKKRLLQWSPFHRYLLQAERQMFEHPNLRMVICNSHMVATEIFERFRIHPAKLRVIYNGVDTHRFHPFLKHHREEICDRYQLPSNRPVALFIGSGWERKGLTQILEALKRVDSMSLLVVGRDKSQRWFEQMSAGLDLSDRVRFVGAQPDVTPFYGAADVFVLPTLYDPFPNAVMEAMAAGLPVLTSHKCGGAELITQCRDGIVFDAHDFKSILNSLDYCCDRERCREMGVEARRTIEPFTFGRMQAELSELYDWILRDKSS